MRVVRSKASAFDDQLVLVINASSRTAPISVDSVDEAARLMQRHTESQCLVLEAGSATWSTPDQVRHSICRRHDDLYIRLFDQDLDARQRRHETSVLPEEDPRSEGAPLLLASASGGRLLLLQVMHVHFTAAGVVASEPAQARGVVDADMRPALGGNAERNQSLVHDWALQARIRDLSESLERETRQLTDAILAGRADQELPSLLSELLRQRSTLRRAQRLAERYTAGASIQMLSRLVDDLDAFGSFTATLLSFKLSSSGEAQRSEQATRDWLLAVGLAAVAFPAVWMAFWSTKAAPEPSSWASQAPGVVGGAILFGLLGICLAMTAVMVSRKRKNRC